MSPNELAGGLPGTDERSDRGTESDGQGRSISVVIVDDHDVIVLGLIALLQDVEGIETVGSASTVADALAVIKRLKPDVVLMDYRLPDGSGIDCARAIRSEEPETNVVMVTATPDRNVLSRSLNAGCCGVLSKGADRNDLVTAIRAATRGDSYFTKDILKHLVHLRRFDEAEAVELTDREVEILQLAANGMSTEETAHRMILSPHTVKNHLRRAMAKLGVHTKLDAVIMALRLRIISIDV